MSMENAILDHAAALRELSAAIKEMNAGRAAALQFSVGPMAQQAEKAVKAHVQEIVGDKYVVETKDAELEQAVQKVEGAAKADAQKTVDEADAKSAAVKAAEQEAEAAAFDAPNLDYAKDVRPVLLAAIKKAGKDTVAAMLKTFGVEKADKLTVDQLPAVLVEAQKLAA